MCSDLRLLANHIAQRHDARCKCECCRAAAGSHDALRRVRARLLDVLARSGELDQERRRALRILWHLELRPRTRYPLADDTRRTFEECATAPALRHAMRTVVARIDAADAKLDEMPAAATVADDGIPPHGTVDRKHWIARCGLTAARINELLHDRGEPGVSRQYVSKVRKAERDAGGKPWSAPDAAPNITAADLARPKVGACPTCGLRVHSDWNPCQCNKKSRKPSMRGVTVRYVEPVKRAA